MLGGYRNFIEWLQSDARCEFLRAADLVARLDGRIAEDDAHVVGR